MDRLEEALILAEPEGFVRVFPDEGPLMADLLRQVKAKGISADYLDAANRTEAVAKARALGML